MNPGRRAAVPLAAILTTALVLLGAAPARADKIREDQWYLRTLGVAEAHRQSQGEGIVIAVIDSGVDATHPDLRQNVLPGTDVVPGGTGDGRADTDGHGTGMASIAAGHGHGVGDGVLGIAPKAKIMPVRFHATGHVGDTNDNARAIEWAIDHGAQIICDANGGGITPELVAAVRRAQRADIVIVAAAGNRPKDTGVLAPASLPGVVAVAATDRDGNHHPISVTGPEIVLAAPGADIVSAGRNGGYRDGTGTSDATAIIAGAAALVRAKYPELTAAQVIHRLTTTATDKGAKGRDEEYGFGALNLVAALTASVPPLASTPPATATAQTTQTAAPTGTANGDGSGSGAGRVVLIGLLALVTAGAVGLVLARRQRTSRDSPGG